MNQNWNKRQWLALGKWNCFPKSRPKLILKQTSNQIYGCGYKVASHNMKILNIEYFHSFYYVHSEWCLDFSCYLELLDKLQKRIYRTVSPSLAASFEPLADHWNIASLSLFYRYYFGRCSSELVQLVPLPYSWSRSTCYSYRLHDFSVTIFRCYKDVYVNSFVPCTARLCNSLPVECFPLTYDWNGFKSWINRHLWTVGSF